MLEEAHRPLSHSQKTHYSPASVEHVYCSVFRDRNEKKTKKHFKYSLNYAGEWAEQCNVSVSHCWLHLSLLLDNSHPFPLKAVKRLLYSINVWLL